jgi:hypothetical protein
MKNIKNFKDFIINEASVPRYHDFELKKRIEIADLKIGDKIKFQESTSLFRRVIPSFNNKVAGYGEEYFLKNEVYEFINYWTDFAKDGGMSFDYHETMAMEFECKESSKKSRIGTKFIFSLRHYHEYRDTGKFIVL